MDLGLGEEVGGTFVDAVAACMAMGFHLALPQSEEENLFYRDMVLDLGGDDYWLGMTSLLGGMGWVAWDGNNVMWTDWFNGQGNDPDDNKYARGHVDAWEGEQYEGAWSDENADTNLATTSVVVCARDIG